MTKRVPITDSMTVREIGIMAVEQFLHGTEDFAVFEMGLEVKGHKGVKLVAVRFTITSRAISSLEELLPATPRH